MSFAANVFKSQWRDVPKPVANICLNKNMHIALDMNLQLATWGHCSTTVSRTPPPED